MHLSYEEKTRLIDGYVSEEERDKFIKHLSECDECFKTVSDALKSMDSINNQHTQKRAFIVILKRKRLIPLLAAMVLLVSLLFTWKAVKNSFFSPQVPELNEILVDHGKQKELILADGTLVTLDSGSCLKYPPEFKGKERAVFLNGEGYFRAASDRKKPFIVYANHAVIKVLGTKFNVRAWDQSQKVEVAVVEGKVSLGAKNIDPETAVLITKEQWSILPNNGRPSDPRKVDINKHLGWINRDLSFKNIPLKEVLYQLERWYEVRFILNENISDSLLITVHIKDRPVKYIIELITDIMGIKYKIEGNTIYLIPIDD
jgi:ferric-dicitrate binding protein FerR (iron transport regulator)